MFGFLRTLKNDRAQRQRPTNLDQGHVDLSSFKAIASGQTIYVIGDIHGRIDLLANLHDEIDRNWGKTAGSSGKLEIYLGDMIDRGSDSAAVVETLIARKMEGQIALLRGNHEIEFLNLLEGSPSPQQILKWLEFGGAATAVSYGVINLPKEPVVSTQRFLAELRAKVPARHLELLRTCMPYYIVEPYLFVHAGIRPKISLENQRMDDLVGIREVFLKSKEEHQHIVVHGHTTVREIELCSNRINLDTGAYATGVLSCIKISRHGVEILNRSRACTAAISSLIC